MEARSQREGQWDGAQRSRGLVSDQDKADGGLREVASGPSPKRQRGIWAGGAGKGTPGGWNSLSKGWRGASEENSGEESLVLAGKPDKLGSSHGCGGARCWGPRREQLPTARRGQSSTWTAQDWNLSGKSTSAVSSGQWPSSPPRCPRL